MYKYLLYTLLVFLFSACTDVIDVDVPTADPRLVIEASIDWEKGTSGNDQFIELSMSTPFFDEDQTNFVTGASVTVSDNTTGQVFIFEDQNNGSYECSDFIPELNRSYTLNVSYQDENYTAEETLMPVSKISRVEQSREGGFDDEALELNMYFPDPADKENYYLIRFYEHGDLLAELTDLDDEFTNGNELKIIYEKLDDDDIDREEFVPGDVVDISLYGVSGTYLNYMQLLIEQTQSGGLFSATPVALKGNCVNITNPDHYPYGYFRLTEVSKITYTFE